MQMANAKEIEQIYAQYLVDPTNVESSWRYFFEGMEFSQSDVRPQGGDFRIFQLVEAYRKFGHLKARVNPIAQSSPEPHELSLQALGFKEEDLKKPFSTFGLLPEKEAPLVNIITALEDIYCGTVSVEYMGCHYPEMERWIQKRIEKTRFRPNLTIDQKKLLLEQLNRAELMETFIHTKYVGQKRFSLEGAETLIPVLADVIDASGVDEVIMGMAHRGRLNVLANILQKSYTAIFSEFEDILDPNWAGGDGDVKYHKGYSSDIVTASGRPVHISLTSNPSHLESVNTVALGKTFAKKQMYKERSLLPILIHGDSSIAGQGIVYESLQLMGLPGYGVGGAIHVIVNNQVGFTTLPAEYRSTKHSTDIALAFSCPVFHVNAEDPEACAYVSRLAAEIRREFHCDVFIEVNGYRKYGHNESDEPAFTQPIEYQNIRKKRSIRELYREKLLNSGELEHAFAKSAEKEFQEQLTYELEEFKVKPMHIPDLAFEGAWKEYRHPNPQELFEPVSTAVEEKTLRSIVQKVSVVPEGFALHKKVAKLVEEREKKMDGELDWASGEQLAFGSLLLEGKSVRLSGQDSQRGTFTQRHAAWIDQNTGKKYFPLAQLGGFTAYNSPLSEFGVLGFEFGYSLANPNSLTLWEAQFGDFANGAQVIIDQYICCSASKWSRYSGLVLLLPHGYEGQGSEHSSARLERFLQLSARGNWQIVYPSTPAQYFHLLRRQMNRQIRIPLVVMTPKQLLRHPKCVSPLEHFTKGTFEEVLEDPLPLTNCKRLLLCSGKVYYDLIEHRKEGVAIVRIEQLYPLHIQKMERALKKYSKVKEIFWVQEEPQNMGSWSYIAPLLNQLTSVPVEYVGRAASCAPATGSPKRHKAELQQIMEMAFG
ncbi:MAG: 2-oxoglutarate dehydrogenase E1 component [Chlamydiales bacterium]|nr:2-oxoglutarate dehydrogenase E1 component [Chlamydiales bacterium]